MTSWKTTLFGLLAATGGAILGAYELKPDLLAAFPKWLPGLGLLASTIGTACIGLAARDNDKSSEDVGVIKPPATSGSVRAIAVSSFLALGLAAVVAGCSGTPARIAYNSAAAPALTVDTAMKLWGDYVAQFHPPVTTELQVKAAFERYQKAELVAIDAAQAYATLSSSGRTNGLGEAQLYSMLSSQTATNALADLVNLLHNIGVKI